MNIIIIINIILILIILSCNYNHKYQTRFSLSVQFFNSYILLIITIITQSIITSSFLINSNCKRIAIIS